METILFLTHTEADGSLGRAALESLTAAKQLTEALGGSSLVAGLLGSQTEAAVGQLAGVGASRILAVTDEQLAQPRYATDAAAATAICQAAQATAVIAPATSRFNRVLPGVSHRLGGAVDTHVSQLGVSDGTIEVTRWFYRQRLRGRLKRAQRPWILLIDPGCYAAWSGEPGTGAAEAVSSPADLAAPRTQVTGIKAPAADAQTIRPDADLLFVTGAGWTKKQADGQTHVPDAEKLILNFLNATRASLGSSKSLVDLGGEGQAVLSFLTHLNQIGQTGATPRHPKGLATCCHGEEPHTVGWRFVNERRVINTDGTCGWARGKADVLYVADAFAVMKKVNELLAS
ncbi:MAG: electron transfer flavoprotein subunit alpha [Verrucomicrobiales bacterium]|nr:electron transfer flavoprotein subunit alpha [Verrucomicrobiales bacterium]